MGFEILKKTNNGDTLSGSEYLVVQDGYHELITTEKRSQWFDVIYERETGKPAPDDPCGGRDCDTCEIGGCDHGIEVS